MQLDHDAVGRVERQFWKLQRRNEAGIESRSFEINQIFNLILLADDLQ